MNEKNKFVAVAIIITAVLAVGGFLLLKNNDSGDTMNDMPKQSVNSSQTSKSTPNSSEAVATTAVEIKDYAFTPVTLKVKVGDKVTWTNQDSVRHDVVLDDETMDGPKSELLAQGESYSYTFTKAGTYAYHCSPHPYMKATIIVEE